MHTCNPSTGETEVGGLEIQGRFCLHGVLKVRLGYRRNHLQFFLKVEMESFYIIQADLQHEAQGVLLPKLLKDRQVFITALSSHIFYRHDSNFIKLEFILYSLPNNRQKWNVNPLILFRRCFIEIHHDIPVMHIWRHTITKHWRNWTPSLASQTSLLFPPFYVI